MLNKIFSKEKINTGRQLEMDLFKGFALILLVLCHVTLYLGDNGDNALFVFGDIIGSEFAAPVFMTMMGMGIIYTKHNSPEDLFKRGVSLLILGYILNFVRSFIPFLIVPDSCEFFTVAGFFIVDILPFAGLTFMLISLFKKIKLPNYVILIIAIIFAGVDQFIFTLDKSNISEFASYFLNLIFPVNDYSCFPLLTWFFFPAFGLVLGDLIIRVKDKNKFYLILLIVGFIAVAYVYGSFIYLYPDYTSYYAGNNFYYMGVINLIGNGLMICFGLAFWYFVSKVLPNFIKKYLSFLSFNLNVFYIFSWLIIGALLFFECYFEITLKTYVVIILMIVVQALTSLATYLYVKLKNKILTKKETK